MFWIRARKKGGTMINLTIPPLFLIYNDIFLTGCVPGVNCCCCFLAKSLTMKKNAKGSSKVSCSGSALKAGMCCCFLSGSCLGCCYYAESSSDCCCAWYYTCGRNSSLKSFSGKRGSRMSAGFQTGKSACLTSWGLPESFLVMLLFLVMLSIPDDWKNNHPSGGLDYKPGFDRKFWPGYAGLRLHCVHHLYAGLPRWHPDLLCSIPGLTHYWCGEAW